MGAKGFFYDWVLRIISPQACLTHLLRTRQLPSKYTSLYLSLLPGAISSHVLNCWICIVCTLGSINLIFEVFNRLFISNIFDFAYTHTQVHTHVYCE